jgi:hypothetical protein
MSRQPRMLTVREMALMVGRSAQIVRRAARAWASGGRFNGLRIADIKLASGCRGHSGRNWLLPVEGAKAWGFDPDALGVDLLIPDTLANQPHQLPRAPPSASDSLRTTESSIGVAIGKILAAATTTIGAWKLAIVRELKDRPEPEIDTILKRICDPASADALRWPGGQKRAGQVVPARTVGGWIARYRRHGEFGVHRGRGPDRGPRFIAGRRFDAMMRKRGASDDALKGIVEELRKKAIELFGQGAKSWHQVRFCLADPLSQIAARHGLTLPVADALPLTMALPSTWCVHHELAIRAAKGIRKHRHHKQAHHAQQKPKVPRDRSALRPMEWVAADVYVHKIVYRRNDGSLATPKTVAFLDLATNRVFARTFLLDKGEGIKRVHVLLALRDMMEDRNWGIPCRLYMDNGSEFRGCLDADLLMQLTQIARDVVDPAASDTSEMEMRDGEDLRRDLTDLGTDRVPPGVIRARPYNPQAKFIEAIFAAMIVSIEPMFPGFTGREAPTKKSENLGRPCLPMPGTPDDVVAKFAAIWDLYNKKPQQRGHIAGRSPFDAYAVFLASDRPWKSLTLSRDHFGLYFGHRYQATVQPNGIVRVAGQTFYHQRLEKLLGQPVDCILAPAEIEDPYRLRIVAGRSGTLCVAIRQDPVDVRSPEGARRSAALVKASNDAWRKDAATVPSGHAGEVALAVTAGLPTPQAETLGAVRSDLTIDRAPPARPPRLTVADDGPDPALEKQRNDLRDRLTAARREKRLAARG